MKRAARAHVLFLMLAIVFFASYLNLIPLSRFAAILFATGFQTASSQLYRDRWKQGHRQFLPLITTLITIAFTDLLIGVFIVLCVGLLFILIILSLHAVPLTTDTASPENEVHLELFQHVRF